MNGSAIRMKPTRRVVVCFGSIQLATALSALKYREKQQDPNTRYENYLVIAPLFAPQGQDNEFAAFIERMAQLITAWQKVIYIPLSQRDLLSKQLAAKGVEEISSTFKEWLDLEACEEIYLANNYDFESRVVMNAYDKAEKICYGNGIGIYTGHSAFLPSSSPKDFKDYARRLLGKIKQKLKLFLSQRNSEFQKRFLSAKNFDIGYFSLPTAFGQAPPMKSIILERSAYLPIFEEWSKNLHALIDLELVSQLRQATNNAPTSILLTSNFSEASGRMSLDNEITAYKEFLSSNEISPGTVLLIKPHPRDSQAKIIKLQAVLSEMYQKVIVLSHKDFFYLPFEILFMAVFASSDISISSKPKIFTFSSACLTLEFLFGLDSIVGFGNDIVERYFYKEHVASRNQHELDLVSTLQQARLPSSTQ